VDFHQAIVSWGDEETSGDGEPLPLGLSQANHSWVERRREKNLEILRRFSGVYEFVTTQQRPRTEDFE
jgi:hypothetical protein